MAIFNIISVVFPVWFVATTAVRARQSIALAKRQNFIDIHSGIGLVTRIRYISVEVDNFIVISHAINTYFRAFQESAPI